MSRGHQPNTIAIWVDHGVWFLDFLSRNNNFAIPALRCIRQGLHMGAQLDDGSSSVVSVLLLPATNGQNLVESKTCILLPELQHRLQIVRLKSGVDEVLRDKDLTHHRETRG